MKAKCSILLCSVFLFFLFACSKDSSPENEMPTLEIGDATSVGRKSATISGSIYVPESSEIKGCGFIYSTVSTLPETESKKIGITLQGSSGTYTANLKELTPNTKYYYCLYANSGYTTTRSKIESFTTAADGVPALEATTSISSTETSLTVASQLSDDGGSDIQKYGFAYKESGSSETEKMLEVTQKEEDGRYTFTITGLVAETSYDVRAFATNAKGTGYGEKIVLTTSAPEMPLVQAEAKAPRSSSVEVTAKLTNDKDLSSGITEVGFCWSTDKEEPTMEDSKSIAQLSGKSFNAVIKDLTPDTKYYLRAYAVNKKTKIGYSNVLSFTTAKSSVPKLDITTATSVDETSVVLQSKVTDKGGHDITKIGFAYKMTGGGTETLKEVPISELKADDSFQLNLTALSSATTYEIRAFAVNSAGTGYGAVCNITTLAQQAPKVSVEVGTPSSTSVAVTGILLSAGGTSSTVKEVGFCWSTGNNPTIADSKVKVSLDGTAFGTTIKELKVGTTYYIRAYAVNETKVGYSEAVQIVTVEAKAPQILLEIGAPGFNSVAVTSLLQSAGDDGAEIKEVGFCWSEINKTPTIADNKISATLNGTSFSGTISELKKNTRYYVRAFAVNNSKIGYSEVKEVTTLDVPGEDDIVSPDKN